MASLVYDLSIVDYDSQEKIARYSNENTGWEGDTTINITLSEDRLSSTFGQVPETIRIIIRDIIGAPAEKWLDEGKD